MESYLVNVYRNTQGEAGETAGFIEPVGVDRQIPFHDIAEMESVLKAIIDGNTHPS